MHRCAPKLNRVCLCSTKPTESLVFDAATTKSREHSTSHKRARNVLTIWLICKLFRGLDAWEDVVCGVSVCTEFCTGYTISMQVNSIGATEAKSMRNKMKNDSVVSLWRRAVTHSHRASSINTKIYGLTNIRILFIVHKKILIRNKTWKRIRQHTFHPLFY